MSANTLHCYALALDPVHVGAGGYRLGRVDNTIIREPGTDLPKLPGSSISGVCRNNAIYTLDEKERAEAVQCATKKDKEGKPAKDQNNCGKCVVCKTFGFASPDNQTGNQIGRVKFFDARLLAFPVRSMIGPLWVTTAGQLRDAGVDCPAPGQETVLVNFDMPGNQQRLNIGWLYLAARKEAAIQLPAVQGLPAGIAERLVVAPEWLYAEIVNNNLEVRTSVSIDFETGAAKSGALFTYEAVPRSALFAFDVVIDTHRCQGDGEANKVEQVVRNGLSLFETLGMGGMNTRGFGRVKILFADQ